MTYQPLEDGQVRPAWEITLQSTTVKDRSAALPVVMLAFALLVLISWLLRLAPKADRE